MSVTVMGLVWDSTLVGSNRRHVLVALADRADEDGVCWPGVTHLSRKTGISRRQVFRILDELETEDWIVRDNTRVTAAGDQDTNLYQINLEKLRANPQPQVDYDEERKAKLARLRDAKNRRSGGSDMVTPPPVEESDEAPGGSDATTPPQCHGVTTGGVTTTPNPSIDPSCDPSGGGQLPGERHQREGTPDPAAPPPPVKADWKLPETWLCGEHLASIGADPGVDRPPCGRCQRVRQWAEPRFAAWQAEAALAAADADADEAERERLCRWHDSAGWVLDPEDTLPAPVRCDHVTPPETVQARALAAVQAPVVVSSEETRRAARELGLSRVRPPVPRQRRKRRLDGGGTPSVDLDSSREEVTV